ncbi:MAG: hypothetical protein FE041_02205 [Thermoplasmata archaeon]|nr:MAG: hypothetical protein FE041_02205 [Thermoplasmata archaeon]
MMKAVILVDEKSLWKICGKSILARLTNLLKKNIEEIYIFAPPKLKKRIREELGEIKFLRSFKDLKEKALIIKGNVFLKEIKFDGDILIGKDGSKIAYIGTKEKIRGRRTKIDGFEIKSREDIKKAEEELSHIVVCKKDIVGEYLTKKISAKIASLICSTYIAPSQMAVAALLIALLSFLFYLLSDYIYVLSAAFLVGISSIVFGVGEELAELKEQRFSELPNIFAIFLILLGFTFFAYEVGKSIYAWIISFFAVMGVFALFHESRFKDTLIGRDVIFFIIFIASLFYQPFIALVVICIACYAELVRLTMVK